MYGDSPEPTEDLLVISIEREDGEDATTPAGNTVIRPRDVVTLFSRTGIADESLRAFTEEWTEN